MSCTHPGEPLIIQASSKDTSAIVIFIDDALLLHRNLDWRSLIQWIDQEPFLLSLENGKINGLISCAPDPAGIAWIHCFAAKKIDDYREMWKRLLAAARSNAKLVECTLCSVGLNSWYIELLETSGFTLLQDIIVLNWRNRIPEELVLPSNVLIRPMVSDDLDQVAQVDDKAFDQIWKISRGSFDQVFMQAEHSNVAEVNGEIVAYEISTSNQFSAHLTRLAVHPDHTHLNIGYTLVREMLIHFSTRGIRQITVNTQSNNSASIALYKKAGFTLSDDTFPVYVLRV